MQSLIAVIFKEDMDRAEAYRVELRGREELAGLVDCSKMVAAVCDKEGKVHLQYTHALAKDGALIGGVLAVIYVTLRCLMDVRIKEEEDLASLFDYPVLGNIPHFDQPASGKKNAYAEPYTSAGGRGM